MDTCIYLYSLLAKTKSNKQMLPKTNSNNKQTLTTADAAASAGIPIQMSRFNSVSEYCRSKDGSKEER